MLSCSFLITRPLANHPGLKRKFWKPSIFSLRIYCSSPTQLCLLFFLFHSLCSSNLAVCWSKALICVLIQLTRERGTYLVLFYFFFFSVTSPSSSSEISIHPSTHLLTHLSIHHPFFYQPTYPSIHPIYYSSIHSPTHLFIIYPSTHPTFVECLLWPTGYQEFCLHLIYV